MGSTTRVASYSKFVLFYASQTGNAKAIAEDLSEQCVSSGLVCDICCVSEIGKTYPLENISSMVLVGSTTGDGDPPDTARKFWRLLNAKDNDSNSLSHISYTVLGLGDTNYTNFCNFGKTIDQRLKSLGAHRFYSCGWADDGTGLETVVEPWIAGLIPSLKNHLLKTHNGSDLKSDEHQKNSITGYVDEVLNNPNDKTSCISEESYNKRNFVNSGAVYSEVFRSNAVNNARVTAEKYGLNILSLEEMRGLPLKALAFPEDTKLTLPVQPLTYLSINILDDYVEEKTNNFSMPTSSSASGITKTNLVSLKTLTRHDAVKRAMEATLEFSEGSDVFDYEPGDSFGIIVQNPKAEVEVMLALLEISAVADKMYELSISETTKKKSAILSNFIPCRSTLRYVLENCVDIRSVPKKALLRTLVEYTYDQVEQRRLKELISKEGSSEYTKYVRESRLSILDLLLIFQSCKPPVTVLLENLPQLQARSYSVTSSPLTHPGKISFVFNVVEIDKADTITFSRKGICTGWLASFDNHINTSKDVLTDSLSSLSVEENRLNNINIYLRSNQTFHLPGNNSFPIIMVGPGTGVAPFIGFLKHRQAILSKTETNLGESWLFYGCRHKDRDYLYKAEMEHFLKEHILDHLYVSYSRENFNNHPKYVQESICLHGAELCSLIMEKSARIYVCGDAKNMAKEVFEAFVSIISVHRDLSATEARRIIAQLQVERRYLQDVWS